MGNYRVVGSVCMNVCVLPLFFNMDKLRDLLLSALVGYGPRMKPIDFEVNQYIFKVKGHEKVKITFWHIYLAYE